MVQVSNADFAIILRILESTARQHPRATIKDANTRRLASVLYNKLRKRQVTSK